MKRHTVTMIMSKAFSASRGLSWQEKKREEGERPLPSPDALFRLVTDHTSGRNLLVSKSVSLNVECACEGPLPTEKNCLNRTDKLP